MKKPYQKPVIYFESFSLSNNIAGSCEKIVTTHGQGNCGIPTSSGDMVFTNPLGGCQFAPPQLGSPPDQWDGFCYHIPIEDATLFNS